ncbi:nucleotidyltransferase family protein [Negadavirga shengliensis]|uniref:NDP-sugar synthase n=1 Tax=Negadavirga shengliensis TaxID=1389218 RepID=A0ABV9SYJ9_9BACT
MKNPTLLILAAGLGSRYGGDKQIDGFGPNGETILEYSVYDAIKAGFDKVVFIVRKEILELTKEIFLPKFGDKIKTEFVIQSLDSLVPGDYYRKERVKPYGTAHALLCAREAIHEPFAVINADDFYGKEALTALSGFLKSSVRPDLHCMVGYAIKNVLSEHGTVSRGVCEYDEEGYLTGMVERTSISRHGNSIMHIEGNEEIEIAPDNPVSMNCWGFHPSVFEQTERLWKAFLEEHRDNLKSEFYIPKVANSLIEEGLAKIKILEGGKTWFGVTYTQDREQVIASLKGLHDEGIYPPSLWEK